MNSKQSFSLVKTHITIALVTFLFGMLIFAGVITHSVGSKIFSLITTIMYFFGIYNASFEIAVRDKKSYTDEKPYPLKGLVLPVLLFIVSIVLYLLYLMAWKLMTINGALFSPAGIINNFLFIIWSFPFNGFIHLADGVMTWYGYIIVAVVPFIASFCGYLAGYKGFDLYGKFTNLIYEKKKSEENK